ncbi:MAG TPA: DUF2339 domain-containing protein [Myxococcales bacterium]|nr:DUF2339 domain-containing protein [Myxococcales bacterium]
MSESSDRDALVSRIAALEKAVDWLQRDLTQLRAQVGRAPLAPVRDRPADAFAAGPPAARLEPAAVAPLAARPRIDLETLIGRYGMLALGTLLALVAAGTFVGWAVAHGLLGPSVRVGLGLVAAAALAVWGLWLRRRERSFGDSILGLSLAIVHVCAWAAGPSMHLVPALFALALSAAASVALAAFALVEGDEPLWCVGFGGAAVAPFVTSTGQGTAPMLAAYGAAVLVAAGSALASRPWSVAAKIFGAGAVLFTVAVGAMPLQQHSAELAVALPFVAGAFGVLPFARGAILRPRLRTLGLLAAAAALRLAISSGSLISTAVTTAVAGVLWLLLLERLETEPAGTVLDGLGAAGADVPDWIDGFVIPAAFGCATCIALPHPAIAEACAVAMALAFVASRRDEGALRDALALVSFLFANLAILVAFGSSERPAVAAVAGNAALFALLERPVPNRSWKWAPPVALALAGVGALVLLTQRPSWGYTPFLTRESLAALAVAASWAVVALISRNRIVLASLWVFAFLWVHQELAWAVNPSAATLLLVTWYAASSVACVGFGRARGEARLRHLGLGLGVIAALVALKAAWGFESTATRIGAYLVVSAFLLGIAWWYRRPGAQPGADAVQESR